MTIDSLLLSAGAGLPASVKICECGQPMNLTPCNSTCDVYNCPFCHRHIPVPKRKSEKKIKAKTIWQKRKDTPAYFAWLERHRIERRERYNLIRDKFGTGVAIKYRDLTTMTIEDIREKVNGK